MTESQSLARNVSPHDRRKLAKEARTEERSRRKYDEALKSATSRFEARLRHVIEAMQQCTSSIERSSRSGRSLARLVDLKTVEFEQAISECRAVLKSYSHDWSVWGPAVARIMPDGRAITESLVSRMLDNADTIYKAYKRAEAKELASAPPTPLVTAEHRRQRDAIAAERKRKTSLGLKEVVPNRIVTYVNSTTDHVSRVYILAKGVDKDGSGRESSLPHGVLALRYAESTAAKLLYRWTGESVRIRGGSNPTVVQIVQVQTIAEATPRLPKRQVGHGLADHYEDGGAIFAGGWP